MHDRINPSRGPTSQKGFVLVASLLLLTVVTLLALSLFRSIAVDQKIGGNVREKQRAFQAAQSALQYAEFWLASGTNATSFVKSCTALIAASSTTGQVCTNALSTALGSVPVTTVPWVVGGVPIGTTYLPPGMNITTTAAAGTYWSTPTFYISLLGASADGLGQVYRIDAVGYGGSPDAIAVVESTYEIGSSTKNLALQ